LLCGFMKELANRDAQVEGNCTLDDVHLQR
jgi:hypothetical protein